MNASQLFTGRAYSFNCDLEIDKEEASYRFVSQVLDKSELEIEIEKISEIECNENFDEYKVEGVDGYSYSVKISLDENCEHILNEINFYKNNSDSGFIPILLDSGKIRVGSDLIFSICSHDNGNNIKDEGVLSIFENIESFFYTIHNFANLKAEISFKNYLDLYLRDTRLEEGSEILSHSVSINHELEEIKDTFEMLNEEVYKEYEKSLLGNDKCCHGVLSFDNIVTRDGLYKLKNFNLTFSGSQFFDIAFLCVNSGFSKPTCLSLFEKYCEFKNISFIESKSEFSSCIKISSGLFFSRILFDYLIEETIFETRRPDRLFDICLRFSKSFHNLKSLDCSGVASETLKKVITSPIVNY